MGQIIPSRSIRLPAPTCPYGNSRVASPTSPEDNDRNTNVAAVINTDLTSVQRALVERGVEVGEIRRSDTTNTCGSTTSMATVSR
jgi:hypothetical protein